MGYCTACRRERGGTSCAMCGAPLVASPPTESPALAAARVPTKGAKTITDAPAHPGRFCSQCGAKTPADAHFCSSCGSALVRVEAPRKVVPAVENTQSWSVAWILIAVAGSLLGYYVLETIPAVFVGAVNYEQSGLFAARILLLPVTAFIVFRLLWNRIRGV